MTDINKYDKKTLIDYWKFISELNYNCEKDDAFHFKSEIMKKISPALAEQYKDLTDSLAFSLYRDVYADKKNTFLYACFDAVSKGQRFYEDCWLDVNLIKTLESRLTPDIILEQNFSNVFPIQDDFYSPIESVLESAEYDASEDFYKQNNKSSKNSWEDSEDIYD